MSYIGKLKEQFKETIFYKICKNWDRIDPVTQIFIVFFSIFFISSMFYSLMSVMLASFFVVFIYFLYAFIWIKQKLG